MSESTACGYTILPQKESIIGICPVNVCKLIPEAFAIFDVQKRALSREAAVAVAPAELVELLDAANQVGAAGNNPTIGIADSTRAVSTHCAIRRNVQVKPRGRFELMGGCVAGGYPTLVSQEAADSPNGSPTLSAVLHRLYGTSPAPEPEPPAPPTAAELAERAEAARKRGILRTLGSKLFPALPVEVSEQRALAIVDAVRAYNAAP